MTHTKKKIVLCIYLCQKGVANNIYTNKNEQQK